MLEEKAKTKKCPMTKEHCLGSGCVLWVEDERAMVSIQQVEKKCDGGQHTEVIWADAGHCGLASLPR